MQFDYKPAKANISGNSLSISGTVNVNVTGGSLSAQAAVSGQTIYLVNDSVNNVVFAKIDPSNNTVKGQISGQTVRLPNDGVNNVVFAQIDPANNTVKGQISGQKIGIINDGAQNAVVISGQTIYTHGTTPKASTMVACVATSGGTALPNLPCIRLLVRSMSGNDVMFVGGTGANAPFSGNGIELYGGEMLPPLEIDNANRLQIFAATAAQKVSIMAIA